MNWHRRKISYLPVRCSFRRQKSPRRVVIDSSAGLPPKSWAARSVSFRTHDFLTGTDIELVSSMIVDELMCEAWLWATVRLYRSAVGSAPFSCLQVINPYVVLDDQLFSCGTDTQAFDSP